MEFENKNVLITGAAKRIGREVALSLAKKGCNIIIHYNSSGEDARSTLNLINSIHEDRKLIRKNICVQADLSCAVSIDEMMSALYLNYDHIDILINNASNFFKSNFLDIGVEEWDMAFNVNLRAPFLLIQHLAKRNTDNIGCVINMADLAGVHVWPEFIHHGASKAGLIHLTQSTALALAPKIRVNSIVPGLILPPSGLSDDLWRDMVRQIPVQRGGNPQNIVETIMYLISNDFITGESIRIDGGEFLSGHGNKKKV